MCDCYGHYYIPLVYKNRVTERRPSCVTSGSRVNSGWPHFSIMIQA